jgi:GH43 family beta-xylosidase
MNNAKRSSFQHHLLRMMLSIALLLTAFGLVSPQVYNQQTSTLRNPLNINGGADPWLTYYDGNYYLAATTWASEWTMRKSPTLAGLKTAEPQRIYFETDPSRCCNFWAPEFHLLDGPNGLRWYFYYTAGTPPGNYDNQKSYVLESEGTDPMGPYTFKGRVYDPQNDAWSIDGSVLTLNDSLYFLFSSWVGPLQSLFIAPMSNPWTISGPRVLISQPELDWERVGGNVNEGPVALQHGDRTFIVYSASGCHTPDYKLGMLAYNGGDPLDPESWVKHPEPIFQRSDENGVYAPGHNGFFKSPDGTEDWIVYHANDSLDGGCDGRRTTRVQKISWNEDGTPNLGTPVSFDEEIAAPSGDTGVDVELPEPVITRFQSISFADAYLRHMNFVTRLDPGVTPLADSQFIVRPGLADPDAVSIESVNFPSFFMSHRNNAIVFLSDDNGDTFEANATWWIRPGLADSSATSFEAYSQPGSFIGQMFGTMALVKQADSMSALAKQDATFIQEQ